MSCQESPLRKHGKVLELDIYSESLFRGPKKDLREREDAFRRCFIRSGSR